MVQLVLPVFVLTLPRRRGCLDVWLFGCRVDVNALIEELTKGFL